MKAWGLNNSLSIYTTRPHGRSGETSTLTMSAWMILLAMMLTWVNVIAWGCIGLYEAARVVF